MGESGPEVLDVAIACEEAAQAFIPPDGIEFEVEVEPDLAAQGDRVLLRQVLIGLLANAFKHSSAPGRVTLRASRAEEEVLIEVTDTGSGIPPMRSTASSNDSSVARTPVRRRASALASRSRSGWST